MGTRAQAYSLKASLDAVNEASLRRARGRQPPPSRMRGRRARSFEVVASRIYCRLLPVRASACFHRLGGLITGSRATLSSKVTPTAGSTAFWAGSFTSPEEGSCALLLHLAARGFHPERDIATAETER